MDSERELQDRITSQDFGTIVESADQSADPETRSKSLKAAQAGVEHAERSVEQESEALGWDDLVQAIYAPAPPRIFAEWSASDALLHEVVDRLVQKGEVPVALIQAAREAVSLDLDEQAQWSGEIESLPPVLATVLQVVTRAEAAIGELEDRPGLMESTAALIEEKELQHAIALELLSGARRARSTGDPPGARACDARAASRELGRARAYEVHADRARTSVPGKAHHQRG